MRLGKLNEKTRDGWRVSGDWVINLNRGVLEVGCEVYTASFLERLLKLEGRVKKTRILKPTKKEIKLANSEFENHDSVLVTPKGVWRFDGSWDDKDKPYWPSRYEKMKVDSYYDKDDLAEFKRGYFATWGGA